MIRFALTPIALLLMLTVGCASPEDQDAQPDTTAADAGTLDTMGDVATVNTDTAPETNTDTDTDTDTDADTDTDTDADVQWGTLVDGGCPFEGPPPGSPLTLAPPATHTGCEPIESGIDGWQPGGTLLVELGTLTPAGTIEPFAEGAWQPMVHGIQGGFHITVYVRVARADGSTIDPDALKLEGYAHVGCEVADAPTVSPAVATKDDPDVGGAIIIGDHEHDGFRWILPVKSALSWQFCGRWIRGSLRVYDKATGDSGDARVYLRMYDTNPAFDTP